MATASPTTPITWEVFRSILLGLFKTSADERRRWLFRGQSQSAWPLLSTFDRRYATDGLGERGKAIALLLREFRTECVRSGLSSAVQSDAYFDPALEMLARHHGLPSPLIDFTTSPYVAAYFAFSGERRDGTVAVWSFDRSKITPDDPVEVVDDVNQLR